MAVLPTNLTNGMGGAAATSFATASISPTAGKLVVIAVYNRKSTGTPATPTVSGAGLTWTQVVTQVHAAGNSRFTIFRAMGASPSAGVLTIDFGGETQQMCHWDIVQWTGARQGGTNGSLAVPQGIGVTNNNTTTSMTGTLAVVIPSGGCATYGGIGLVDVVGAGISPGDGETELVDQTNNVAFNWRSQFQWKQGTDNSMSWTYASGGNQPTGAFVEIREELGGAFILNLL